jgi:hypothetical protein
MVNARTDGYDTARYPVPPESPRGDVYVTSFGVNQMEISPGVQEPMLHTRLAVSNNNGGATWTVDSREQLVDLGPEGRSRPAFVNTDVQGSPLIPIPSGAKRVIDFYYALPVGLRDAEGIPRFDFVWTLLIPGRPVVQRTPFDRVRVDSEVGPDFYPPYVSVGLGWGPFWWYDPLYPTLTFYHPWVLHHHYPVIVGRGYVGPRFRGPAFRGSPVGGGFRGRPPGGGLRGGGGFRGSPRGR